MSASTNLSTPPQAQGGTSRWPLALGAMWLLLLGRLVVGVVRSQSLRDDMGLETIALFVVTALLGSRAWGAWLDRRGRS